MTLKDQLPADAANVFLNENEFAESITYKPHEGGSKTLKAVVVRNRLDAGSEDSGRVLHKECEVYIANSSTDGVSEVKKGADNVVFPETIGQADVSWAVIDIIDADNGMWHLLVGR